MTRLSNPAPGRPVTSPFGPRRHPITGKQTVHRGDDFGGSFDVLAAADGVVVVNGFEAGGYGYYVIVEHNLGGVRLRTLYAHGAHRSKHEVGQPVVAGEVIFRSGSTGLSTGNHLHFEVHEKDQFGRWRAVNPAPYINGATPDEEQEVKTVEGFYAVVDGVPSWMWINWATGRVFSVHTQAEADHIGSYMGSVTVLTDSPTASAGEKYKTLIVMATDLLGPASGGDLRPVLDAVSKVPTSTVDELKARL